MKTEPNDPTNACTELRRYGSEYQFVTEDFYPGLTKREYFAAMAMQGCIINSPIGQISNSHYGCQLAIKWADNLIDELNKASK